MIKDHELNSLLKRYALEISKEPKAVGLIKQMQPMDVISVIQNKFEIQPKDALSIFTDLLINHKILPEWAAETLQFPVKNYNEIPDELDGDAPLNHKKRNPLGAVALRDLDEDYSLTGLVAPGVADMSDNVFPPKPRGDAEGWPYDDNTIAIMDPHTKSHKRGLGGIGEGFSLKEFFSTDGSPSRRGNLEPGIAGSGLQRK